MLVAAIPRAALAAQDAPASPEPLPPPPPPPPPPTYEPPPPPADGPRVIYVQAPKQEPLPVEDHAPKYSLWAGARLSFVGFGFSFYENQNGQTETTGNYLKNGIAPQVDVGARIAYRYVPYLFFEHGFMGQGHRFEGTDATASTDFFGIGFRYVSGDVDSVSFLTDLSIGKRVIRISEGSQEYTMSGLEFFRLGLGAEIRIRTLFALSPLLSISSGSLNDTSGTVNFNCEAKGVCADGLSQPRYTKGQVIDDSRAYVVLSLGVGIHFDIFGK